MPAITKLNIHNDLKIALRLQGVTIRAWGKSLKKPDGSVGISHTAVIRVARGDDKTSWIRTAIESLIDRTKLEYPAAFERQSHSMMKVD
jgi:hypothetical protein